MNQLSKEIITAERQEESVVLPLLNLQSTLILTRGIKDLCDNYIKKFKNFD